MQNSDYEDLEDENVAIKDTIGSLEDEIEVPKHPCAGLVTLLHYMCQYLSIPKSTLCLHRKTQTNFYHKD